MTTYAEPVRPVGRSRETVVSGLVHMWAQTGRGVPGMTACAIVGPVLPVGNTGRPRLTPTGRVDVFTCSDCAHLCDCEDEECGTCAAFAAARVTAAAGVLTLRLYYRRTPFARVDEVTAPAAPEEAPAAPEGPANPERIDVGGRTVWRFHLVDGIAPNKAAKPLRRALWALRAELGTFTLAAGGDGTRSINVIADGPDPGAPGWETVCATAREELGRALAGTVPVGGRHVDVIPF